jgi:hypothetical protein
LANTEPEYVLHLTEGILYMYTGWWCGYHQGKMVKNGGMGVYAGCTEGNTTHVGVAHVHGGKELTADCSLPLPIVRSGSDPIV